MGHWIVKRRGQKDCIGIFTKMREAITTVTKKASVVSSGEDGDNWFAVIREEGELVLYEVSRLDVSVMVIDADDLEGVSDVEWHSFSWGDAAYTLVTREQLLKEHAGIYSLGCLAPGTLVRFDA